MKKQLSRYLHIVLLTIVLLGLGLFSSCTADEPSGPPPIGSFENPVTGSPGGRVMFKGTAEDKNGLASITLFSEVLGLDKVILLNQKPSTYELEYGFTLPLQIVDGTYSVSIQVKNAGGKASSYAVDLVVTTANNFEAIWVAGGVLWRGWSTPQGDFYEMQKDEANLGWFEIVVPSWSGNNEIKFLGQNGWAGNNWGLVDNTNSNSAMLDAENSQAIKLPDLGKNPAYYKVRFNPNTMTYSYTEIAPTENAPAEMFIVGKGFTDYPNLNWSPSEAIAMTSKPSGRGDYQFLIEGLKFSDAVELKFIGQNTGWGPIDIGFDEDYLKDSDPSTNGWQVVAPINWKIAKSGDGTADLKFNNQVGTYTVYFDFFLKRAVIYKTN
jgi:hypothetical protein